jgi:hypothetical protein
MNESIKCGTYTQWSSTQPQGMWFEDKRIKLEDIMLSDVCQAQKDKGCMFSLIHGRYIQKINIRKNKQYHIQTRMYIFVIVELLLICRTCL